MDGYGDGVEQEEKRIQGKESGQLRPNRRGLPVAQVEMGAVSLSALWCCSVLAQAGNVGNPELVRVGKLRAVGRKIRGKKNKRSVFNNSSLPGILLCNKS